MLELARRFLRCLIIYNEKDNLGDNGFQILESPINFAECGAESIQEILNFVRDFYKDFEDYPTYITVKSRFEDLTNLEVLQELEEIKVYPPQTGTGFLFNLRSCVDEINRVKFNDLIKKVDQINNGAVKEKKDLLKGTRDAVNYLFKNSEQFFYTKLDQQTECEVSESTAQALERFEKVKNNPSSNFGILSGFDPIDTAIKGIKKKDLLLIAGAVGECKTTLALNWAYNAAVLGGWNVLYVSLEMSKENIQDILYSIHSASPFMLDIGSKRVGRSVALDFDQIKEGDLDEDQEKYYRFVLEDWRTRGATRKAPERYGNFTIWEPSTELTPSLLQAKVDYYNKKDRVDLLVVDYPGLMSPESNGMPMSETSGLNQIMKRLKRMALTFNNSNGIAVICPFQINREGKKEVVKKTENDKDPVDFGNISKPVYSFYHLSYANEAERSADYILYTYLNHELRENDNIHIGCIKNRHGKIFSPFLAQTILAARHISYAVTSAAKQDIPTGIVQEINI